MTSIAPPSPPPSPLRNTSSAATAAALRRVGLIPGAMQFIIEYLPCNTPSAASGGGSTAAAAAPPPSSPATLADALFAAATQPPSTAAAAASSAPWPPVTPSCVTRPLALVAASPMWRRALEAHLIGGCALPPLGSLVLQVQPHRLGSPAPSRQTRRRRRTAAAAAVDAGSAATAEVGAITPVFQLLVSSTNVSVTVLPFQSSSRSPSRSPVTQMGGVRTTPPPPPPLQSPLQSPGRGSIDQAPVGGATATPPPPPSTSPVWQSRRLTVHTTSPTLVALPPPSTPPPRAAVAAAPATPPPATTSTALETLCRALWWVRRGGLPVSLTLVRYKEADVQALWARLAEEPPPVAPAAERDATAGATPLPSCGVHPTQLGACHDVHAAVPPTTSAVDLLSSVAQLHVRGGAAEAAVASLLPAHPEVRSLRLTHGTLSDAQLRHLARVCPDVSHLSVAMNRNIQTTSFLCPPPSDTSSATTAATTVAPAAAAAVGSSAHDVLHHLRHLRWGGDGDGDGDAAVARCSEGSRVTAGSAPSHLPHRSSQLDLFAPEEEGEADMRLSLWQAAQADAAERRQPVFVLRPDDVVLGRAGAAAAAAATGTTAATVTARRGAASRAAAREPASPHSTATERAAAIVGAYADPHRRLPPRHSNASCPELAVSLLQPSAPTSTSVTAAVSPMAMSLVAGGSGSGAIAAAAAAAAARPREAGTAARDGRDGASPVTPPKATTTRVLDPTASARLAGSPRGESNTAPSAEAQRSPRRRRNRTSTGAAGPPRRRSTHWAHTLVDLDLSYTHITDADAARDVPQLRRLHHLSLEGCMQLSQVTWLPLLPQLRAVNLSLSSVQGHALHPLGRCSRLAWLKLDGCTSFTAVHQLWRCAAGVADAAGVVGVPAVRHTTIGGIPAITVVPPPAGLLSDVPPIIIAAAAAEDGGVADDDVEVPLCGALRVLIATGTGLTDTGLRSLGRMAGLECAVLDRCSGITDVGVAAELPSLHTLDVSRTRVTAAGLARLRLSSTLRQLRLQDCLALTRLPALLVEPHPPTTTGPARIAAAHPPLTVLDCSFSKHLAAGGLAGLVASAATVAAQAVAAQAEAEAGNANADGDDDAEDTSSEESEVDGGAPPPPPSQTARAFAHVRHVLLRSCEAVAHLRPLRDLTRVVELDLYHTNVSDATLTRALASWTCLEVLNIASTRVRSLAAWCPPAPPDEAGETLRHARPRRGRLPAFAATLRVLVLSNTDVTAAGLAALSHFPQLAVLNLSGCRQLTSLRFLLPAAASQRTALVELAVTEAAKLNDAETFRYLVCCSSLRTLSLAGCVQLGGGVGSSHSSGDGGGSGAAGARDARHPSLPPLRRSPPSSSEASVAVLGAMEGLAELNLSNTAIDLDTARATLAPSPSPSPSTTTASRVSLSLQRLWLRGCRRLDEGALLSTATAAAAAAAAAAVGVVDGDGSSGGGGVSAVYDRLPLLREVFLSHGKYGAEVLAGLFQVSM
ncbi:hypothetical protein NESM_000211100 [Novymonas esmeraldas]|uniref:Uncharacterized protein n=1 Tax=Novymonas esmeraldas TaxID=1808958 RepID=A0AAW0F5N9_9TRYP